MQDYYRALLKRISYDEPVSTFGGDVFSLLDSVESQTAVKLKRFPIEVVPMGFSQTISGGSLNLVHYFCLKIIAEKNISDESNDNDNLIALGERLAQLVHGLRLDNVTAYLSKCMIIDSSFVLQNLNRRINVKLEENQIGQILFFWATKSTTSENGGQDNTGSSISFDPSPLEDNDPPPESESESELLAAIHEKALSELFP